jgi:hypothetical protein
VQLAELDQGISLIEQGWAAFKATGGELGGTCWRALKAQAYVEAGRW